MHYRGTLQVPMVIADPTAQPGRTDSLAGSIDLPTTLLDRAGLPHYEGMQGHSLRPVLGDPATAVRDHVLIEEVRQRLIGEWICHPPEATECKFGKSKASKPALTCSPQRHASEAVLGLRPVTPR